jgi:hypothetical protein
MRIIIQKFEEIWQRAERFNKERRTERFFKIYEQRKKYLTIGLYDSQTKKYALFDTVNLTGNFRYDNNVVPEEVLDMGKIVARAYTK